MALHPAGRHAERAAEARASDAAAGSLLGDVLSLSADGGTLIVRAGQDALNRGAAWRFASVVPPGALESVTAAPGDGEATVSFTPPSSIGSDPILTYTVTASPGGTTANGAASPIRIAGLSNGVGYTFTVTATSAADPSPASAPSAEIVPVEGGREHPPAPEPTGPRPETPAIVAATGPRPPRPRH